MSKYLANSISVFFPCYNDASSIRHLVNKAFRVLPSLTNKYEVIVVNDASTDNSLKVLTKLATKYPNLRIISHSKNRGYGGSLSSGFQAAKYQLIFYTDGDGQYDVGELPILVNLMTKDVNFVNGIKLSRKDPTYRIVIGNLYSFIARWAFWLPVYDVDCDFRLIRKDLAKKIKLTSTSGAVCVELVKKAEHYGGKFRQVSIHHYERRFGKSQFFQIANLSKTFIDFVRLWYYFFLRNRFFRHPKFRQSFGFSVPILIAKSPKR